MISSSAWGGSRLATIKPATTPRAGDDELSAGTAGFPPHDEDLSVGTPASHPTDEDLSVGTPASHPTDEDLSVGTPASVSRASPPAQCAAGRPRSPMRPGMPSAATGGLLQARGNLEHMVEVRRAHGADTDGGRRGIHRPSETAAAGLAAIPAPKISAPKNFGIGAAQVVAVQQSQVNNSPAATRGAHSRSGVGGGGSEVRISSASGQAALTSSRRPRRRERSARVKAR